MKIIVPIKQVPETGDVRLNEEAGTLIRDGVENIVNPFDLNSIELALTLKEVHGGSVTVVSMGPPGAKRAVFEALSMGCDDGILLTDAAFAGSDTLATSYILSTAIDSLGGFDIILTGIRATDGDTGQVGPGLAAKLDIPMATFVSRIKPDGDTVTVMRLIEGGFERVKLPLPCLVTVVNDQSFPRIPPTLKGKQKARGKAIKVMGAADLGIDLDKVGLLGSPTKVTRIMYPKQIRTGKKVFVKDLDVEESVDQLIAFMRKKDFL